MSLASIVQNIRQLSNAGNLPAALAQVNQYWKAQTATRGFAADMIHQLNNVGFFGCAANLAMPGYAQPGSTSYQKYMIDLALGDYAILASQSNITPTETEIDNNIYNTLAVNNLPISSFLGAAWAATGNDWGMGTLNSYELSDTNASLFRTMTTDQIDASIETAIGAGRVCAAQTGEILDALKSAWSLWNLEQPYFTTPTSKTPIATEETPNGQIVEQTTANGLLANFSLTQEFDKTTTAFGYDGNITENNHTINLYAGASFDVTGINDVINAPYANDYVGITHTGDLSNIDTINAASGASIGEISGAAVNVVGSNENITLSPNAYLGVFGTGDGVFNASGCKVGAPSGSTFNQTGSNVTDILAPNVYMGVLSGSTGVAIRANNDSFGAQSGTDMTVKGSNDGFTAYDASIGVLSGDQGMSFNAADCQVTSLTNTSIIDNNSTNSTFAGEHGDVMTLYGDNIKVFGNYMDINFIGSYDTCDGNWNTVDSNGSSDYCYGYHDEGLGDTIEEYGPPTSPTLTAGARAASIRIDLLAAKA